MFSTFWKWRKSLFTSQSTKKKHNFLPAAAWPPPATTASSAPPNSSGCSPTRSHSFATTTWGQDHHHQERLLLRPAPFNCIRGPMSPISCQERGSVGCDSNPLRQRFFPQLLGELFWGKGRWAGIFLKHSYIYPLPCTLRNVTFYYGLRYFTAQNCVRQCGPLIPELVTSKSLYSLNP